MSVSYRIGGRLVEVPEEGYFENNPDYVVLVGLGNAGAEIDIATKTTSPG
ncbi:hypothetical protein K2Z84_34125 [Candidatus Binatia bacterium]|nr:hypothetical protein [Candidatus Binatia bacterium]